MNSLDNVQLNYASWCNRIIYFVGRILAECHVFQKGIHDLSLLNKFAMNNIRIVNKTTYANFNFLKNYSYLLSWYLSLRFHRFFQNFQPLSPLSIVFIYGGGRTKNATFGNLKLQHLQGVYPSVPPSFQYLILSLKNISTAVVNCATSVSIFYFRS